MRKKRPKTATIRKSWTPLRALEISTCLLLLLTSNTFAQGHERPKPSQTAIIFGTVWGPNDRPLAGVKVKMRRAQDKKARAEKYSNRLGEFEFEVPAGRQDYVIWADTKGYKLQNGRQLQPSAEVTVHIESNERADTGLHLQ